MAIISPKYKLSVRLMTYMHESFVNQAMDGIMMQKTDFKIEVVVGDDFSTDRTLEIIKSYKNTESIDVKILKREKGDEYWRKRQKLGRLYNFTNILENCTGKYIALLDGDDYWTDPLKLQKQVDFLEGNTNYAGVATNSKIIFESSGQSRLFKKIKSDIDLNINDFLKQRYFHTASFVLKKEFLKTIVFPKVLSGDRFLFLFIASKGTIRYLNDTTCVYRKNEGGISNKVTSSHMIADLNFINASNQFLNKNQILILKKFIYKTIFEYSHKIKLNHFIIVSIKLLLVSGFDYKTRRLLKKNFKKVEI